VSPPYCLSPSKATGVAGRGRCQSITRRITSARNRSGPAALAEASAGIVAAKSWERRPLLHLQLQLGAASVVGASAWQLLAHIRVLPILP
jgi:hypothetical protein